MQFALVERRYLSCKFVSKKSSNCTEYRGRAGKGGHLTFLWYLRRIFEIF